MSGDYHIDLDSLGDAIAAMQGFETWWENAVVELDKAIADLHTTWIGEAASAQKDAYTRWSDGTAKLRDALSKLRDSGHVALGNYTSAADTGSDMWNHH